MSERILRIDEQVWQEKHAERTMRWLRANGVTEAASEIMDNVHLDCGSICYEVVFPDGGRHRLMVPERVTFAEANREAP